MSTIKIHTHLLDEANQDSINNFSDAIKQAHQTIKSRSGAGSNYLGWLDPFDRNVVREMNNHAQALRNEIDAMVVIGIGGSYLGARAVYELLTHSYKQKPKLYFVGNHIGSDETQELLDEIDGMEIALNVISKSGTTTEPGIAFRIFRDWMISNYGEKKTGERIYATTDPESGALRKLADQEGYTTFSIPQGAGGRYSVCTPVGLFPLAVAGVNIDELLDATEQNLSRYQESLDDEIMNYVGFRNAQYADGKKVEILSNFTPKAHFLGEWWKQLFGESEGKEGKGLYPDTLDFTTDLHSLGQYVQQGERIFLQTCIKFESDVHGDRYIGHDEKNYDNLNYLKNLSLTQINHTALEATTSAHSEGGVPTIILELENKSEKSVGAFIAFMMYACALSGYVLGVNPFDQPGVEAYKNKMFTLLGKPTS